jgi:acyl-CoA synthetase (AMP-forming)/AMP-acid ligase II
VTPDVPARSLWQTLVAAAERRPAKAAVVFGDEVLRYGDLLRQAEALAGWLQTIQRVARGDRVLLMSQNSPQFVVATYAILRADAVVVPVNAMWTRDEIAHVVRDSGAKVGFAAAEFAERVQGLVDIVPWREALAAGRRPLPHAAGVHDLAVLPYTSGTTGRPKGCMHTHATVQASNLASVAWRGFTGEDVFFAVAPLFHAMGMQNGMHLPLMLGGTVAMLPRWDRDAALDLIERRGVTTWAAAPSMLIDFFAHPALTAGKVKSLRLVTGGSAPMPPAVAEAMWARCGIRYNEGYGMTETASFLQANPVDRPKAGTLGVAGPGTDTRIVDPDTLRELPRGEVGEIVTCAPQVMLGYWNDEAATREAFVHLDGRRFLRTGDLAFIDHDGYFVMKDRLKRMINAAGYKVWPAEVEARLYEHPAVHEACVIGAPDARRGEIVKAVVVRKPGAVLDADDFIAWCRCAMAVYKAPRSVEFVESLPKSNTGKILWRELQQKEADR